MAEDQNPVDNVEIEPLSDEELEDVAGGTIPAGTETSGGPSCCSCRDCSNGGAT